MPVTTGGRKVWETTQASGQDVPAPQIDQILAAIQRPCFRTKHQKHAYMQSVRIRTSPSPLITQGWQWPLQGSGDCRSSGGPHKHRTWSGCCSVLCQTSLVQHQGSQLCPRTETGSVRMGRQRCPRAVENQNVKKWPGYLENHLTLGQQERGWLMSWDLTVILPQTKTLTCDSFGSQTYTITVNPKGGLYCSTCCQMEIHICKQVN